MEDGLVHSCACLVECFEVDSSYALRGLLAAEDSAFHTGQIVLLGVVAAQEEVGHAGGLVGAIAVHAGAVLGRPTAVCARRCS